MAKAMTKTQVMAALAEALEISKKDAVRYVETLVNLAYREAPNGFTIPGLGKLVVVNRKARMGRNPQTGEPLHIPAKTVLKFRIAKAAKDKAEREKKLAADADVKRRETERKRLKSEIDALLAQAEAKHRAKDYEQAVAL